MECEGRRKFICVEIKLPLLMQTKDIKRFRLWPLRHALWSLQEWLIQFEILQKSVRKEIQLTNAFLIAPLLEVTLI